MRRCDLFPVLLAFLLLLAPAAAFGQTPYPDSDGDAVADSVDVCDGEDASFFDADGDGCIDEIRSARHLEFWGLEDLPLSYVIHEDGAPGIGDGSDTAAIDAAFASWTAVSGVNLSAVNAGTSPQAVADGLDGVNLITWSDDEYDFGPAVLAVGLTTSFTEPTFFGGRWVRPGQIVDADMIFNPAQDFRTPTWGSFGNYIQGVATHEAGHLFGISHSAVKTSTMFFVLPPLQEANSLEPEDAQAIFKAYPDAATLSAGTRLSGSIQTSTGDPVSGGAVFATSTATGDTVGLDYSLPDGSWEFANLPAGSYEIAVHPLDGSSDIGYLLPGYVNELVDSTATVLFVPEYWDLAESDSDDPTVADPITLTPGEVRTGVDIILNVDSTPPTVTEAIPGDTSADVRIDAAVLISFDEAIDASTISGNFTLENLGSAEQIAGSVAILEDDAVLAFTPSGALDYSANYRLTLGTGLTDLFGNGLSAPFNLDFSTEAQPPVNVSSIIPSKGTGGTAMVINGVGFDPVPGNNLVDFAGVPAAVTQASPTRLLVSVPDDAATGEVTVTANGNTSIGIVFTVVTASEAARGTQVGGTQLPATPRGIAVTPDGSYAYVATDLGLTAIVVDAGLPGYLLGTEISLDGAAGTAVATSPDGKRVYAVSRTDRTLFEIDSDPDDTTLFNTILDQIGLGAEPIGVTVGPGGRYAYVSTAGGVIQVWDVGRDSATYRRQVGEINAPATSLRGSVAVDPTHELVLALSSGGEVWAFSANGDSLESTISVGLDPRDIVVEPAGTAAYVSDNDGSITIVDLDGRSVAGTIVTPGAQRGISITPDGLFLYATDRALDQVDVIDLNPANSTFLSVGSEIDAGLDPTDVAVSPDGRHLYTLVQDSMRMEVTGIGFGPVIRSIMPKAAPVGAKLVIAGSNLPGMLGFVNFDGIVVQPDRSTGTALEVEVPAGFAGGPVTVEYLAPATTELPSGMLMVSNPVYFEVLDPTDSGPSDRLTEAGFSPQWQLGQVAGEIAVSPNGDLLAVAGQGGRCELLDINPLSPTYTRSVAFFRTFNSAITDLAFTPDGKRLFMACAGDDVARWINTDLLSAGFAKDGAALDQSQIDPLFIPEKLAVSPDGEFIVVTDQTNDALAIADIIPGSTSENQFVGQTAPFGYPLEVKFHPGGEFAYLVATTGQLHVIDVNPLSGNFLQQVNAVTMPPSPGTQVNPEEPISLSFTPDGDRCLVLTLQTDGAPENRSIVTFDTSVPGDPSFVDQLALGAGTNQTREKIAVSPRGDRAVVNVTGLGILYYDIGSLPYQQVDTANDFEGLPLLATADENFSIDGNRLYLAYTFQSKVYFYDFSGATDIEIVSGNNQVGVTGQKLPAPLRVYVNDGVGSPASGATVTFRTASSPLFGGYLGPLGGTAYTTLTDENGFIDIDWILGQVGALSVTAELGDIGNSVTFNATSLENPESLPLNLAQVLPLDGTSNVSATSAVQATFSRAVARASATPTAYFVAEDSIGPAIPALIGYADGDRKLSLTPSAPLDYSTLYRVEVTGALADLDGGTLENPAVTTFSTAAPPPLALFAASPPSGPVGAELVLSGQGFDADPTQMTVLFNGLEIVPTQGSIDFVRVSVPADAVTGTLQVRNSLGETSGTIPFTVLVPTDSPLDEVVATVNAGASTKAVAVTPSGDWAYTVSPEANTVIPVDLAGFVSSPSITVGAQPVAIVIAPDGSVAYVANYLSNNVSVIDTDPASGSFQTVLSTIPVGIGPIDLAVDPAGDRIYVALLGEPGFDVIDGDALSATYNSVIASVGGSNTTRSVAVSPDGTLIYFGTSDGYIVVGSGDYDTVIASVGGSNTTRSVAISPDGTLLFVLTSTGDVDIYDVNPGSATENQVIASVGGSNTTRSVAVSPDGTLLYLIQEDSDEILVVSLETVGAVSVLDPNSLLPPPNLSFQFLEPITVGGDPELVAFDPSGSGLAIVATSADQNLTFLNVSAIPFGAIEPEIHVSPNTLNLGSRGRWVTASIELPRGIFLEEIDISTVMLQDEIPAELDPVKIQDSDQDGIPELVVKFDREAFQDILTVGEFVEVRVSGFAGDRSFAGTDVIRTIRPQLLHPLGGENFLSGPTIPIAWELPEDWTADYADVEWSGDEGVTWNQVALGVPASQTSVDWMVPEEAVGEDRILVTLYEEGEVIGQSLSRTFTVEMAVPVAHVSAELRLDGRDAVLSWTAQATAPGLTAFRVLRADGPEGEFEQIGKRLISGSSAGGELHLEFRDEGILANQEYSYLLEESWGGTPGNQHGPYLVTRKVVNALSQNYPNAFNPRTTIQFSTAQDGPVKLVIYDVRGRVVRTLVDEYRRADEYSVIWSGTDNSGSQVASGTYFYRLVAPGFTAARKMALIR